MKKWNLLEKYPEEFKENFSEYPSVIIQLLYNRKLKSPSMVQDFFNVDYQKLHDPFLFKDMVKAVKRVWRAINKQEKVLIYGDYDADGVTSAAIIYKTLKKLKANVEVFIPHREKDGYGLNIKNIKKFIEDGFELLITVDCGITNFDEVALAQEAGLDVVITDHHEPPEVLPDAVAILDPKVKGCGYPFSDLAGAGVAFKLMVALLKDRDLEGVFLDYGGSFGWLKWLLDLVAVGTVADVSLLLGENRILVKYGLLVLSKTRNIGLQKLAEVNSVNLENPGSFTIGFQLAPCLNAAGRISHAQRAFELLVVEDVAMAEELAKELRQNNLDRQKLTEKMFLEAQKQVEDNELQVSEKIYFAYNENWPAGLVGLVAGRLSDRLSRPVLVMTKTAGDIVGSGRSVPALNIVQALYSHEDYFLRFGGHSQACGFTLKSEDLLSKFKEKLGGFVNEKLVNEELVPVINVEVESGLQSLDWQVVDFLDQFSPFGEGNSRPLFLVKNLEIAAVDFIGKNKNHLRLLVKSEGFPVLKKLLGFRLVEKFKELQVGQKLDALLEVSVNDWNGRKDIEFRIEDLRLK